MDIWQLIQQLEEQSRRDPQALIPLIEVYEQILAQIRPEEYPTLYASIQNSLGNAYGELPTDDRGANLTRAIACYQEALRFQVPKTAPLDYATIQHNLGNAYSQLPTGDRAANLRQAIACYQEALRFRTPEGTPLEYAGTQNSLGVAYSDLPIGDQAANLRQAIACYQEALRFWTLETAPLEYAGAQHNLGAAYSQLPTGDRVANLRQAIACYQEALRFWTPETAPLDYAMTQHSLGAAYSDLPIGDHAANLRQAIACYQEALRFWTPEGTPLDYATIQNSLGAAYNDLPTGDRVANLRQAIACYQEALRFRTPEGTPLEYATTQNNLGLAYSQLPTGDRAANLRQAITRYQEALRFWTPETAPLDYAMTQHNLGLAYSDLPTGDRAANLRQAIACYQEALRFWTPETAPLDYAITQNSIGAAYSDLLTGDRAANLRQAITCYQEALRFWTPETAPLDYTMTQHNLGNAYSQLPTGDRAANLRQAITCYQEALRFRTSEATPLDYATIQNSLGNTYSDLLTGDRATNLRQAITRYQEALRFWTPEATPLECRRTNRNLADLYFAQGEWKAALDAYRAAMDAGEQLYRAGLSAESKATEMAENIALYRHAAFSAIRCGETAEALLALERGKTRLLVEALRLSISRPANVPDEVWSTFEKAGEAVRAVQVESTASVNEERDSIEAYTAREKMARAVTAALDLAIERVRIHAPEFLRLIDLPTIQTLLPDEHTVLVAFCITGQGSVGFVVDQHAPGVQVVEVPMFTQAVLRRLSIEADIDGSVVGGWLGDYYRFQMEHTQATEEAWKDTITHTLLELGQRLLAPILSALSPGVKRIIFLPSAELFLLPLHAAPLSIDGSERVCDRYQVSYAPSLAVLADTRAKAMQVVTPELYVVVNPTADPRLPFTQIEGRAIARLFERQRVDEGRSAGTKRRVINGVRGRSYVHFACHGSYNWDDPATSGLELTDSRLTLAELQHGEINLSASRLVALSACESGVIDIVKGSAEEYVGIPAGFLVAGVPCVVSSLWAVPDLSTTLLMERFYANHLSGGMDFAAALREAQMLVRDLSIGEVAQYAERCYRESKQKEKVETFRPMRYYGAQAKLNPALRPFAHPYYWAAFTVNGM